MTDSQALSKALRVLEGIALDVDYIISRGLQGHHDEIDVHEALSILRQVKGRAVRALAEGEEHLTQEEPQ